MNRFTNFIDDELIILHQLFNSVGFTIAKQLVFAKLYEELITEMHNRYLYISRNG